MKYVSQSPIANAVSGAGAQLFRFGYKHIAKPIFFSMPPDKAHDLMISGVHSAGQLSPVNWALRTLLQYTDPALETTVMGLHFDNPFGLSAGLDKDCMLAPVLDAAGFGFETAGSITSRPCPGNPKPWFHRLPEYGSMVVHAGLANEGADIIMPRAQRAHEQLHTMKLSLSLARTNDQYCGDLQEGIEDYCISLQKAAGTSDMIEINISCPNTMVGETFTERPEHLDKLFTALDEIEHPQPILVKMPLNKSWEEFKDFLDVLAEHKVQGVSIANLQKDRSQYPTVPKDWEGGLSGLPCRQASTELVARTYLEYGDRFAIAGIGGVFTPQQAYAKIRAGASLVMFVSSLMYVGPQNIATLKRGLVQLLHQDGFDSVEQAVGADFR